MSREFIKIGGAREHNLKNLTLTIPRDKLVVVTGLSGSGKSSLAFDTIYAEGQRKYVESLSAYARQFLGQLKKPEVDFIEGLSPSIAIEQRGSAGNPRSTVATVTEIYDYLRLLYAHVAQPHCPVSGVPITSQTSTNIVDRILGLPQRARMMLLAPVVAGEKGEFRDVIERLAREGFVRARVDGELVELAVNTRVKLDPKKPHRIEVVVDRLVNEEKVRARLSDSVETALRWGNGLVLVLHQPSGGGAQDSWTETLHSTRMFSPATGRSFEPLTPKHFSFNSPSGACPVCHGLGQKLVFDAGLVVPDPKKTLEGGAVLPWRRGGKRMVVYYKGLLKGVCKHYEQSLETPWESLPESFRSVVLHGAGSTEINFQFWRGGASSAVQKTFEGVLPNLERLYQESESEFTRNRLKGFMSPQHCDVCGGRRLRPEVLAATLPGPGRRAGASVGGVEIPGLSIMDFCALTVREAEMFLDSLQLGGAQTLIASEPLREVRSRLRFLSDVGLGYLTLDRESGTLSGGEAQRIRLATQIGAGLVGVLYILDEPSIGLHQRDNERLLRTLEHLRDLGNSVLVVEHDEDTIRRADYVLDLGPGAGVKGGEIVAAGTVEEVMRTPGSLTAKYLTRELDITVPRKRCGPDASRGWLELLGARANNLRDVDLRIPLGTFTCVTGVSGSGKSTLVDDTLRRALMRIWHGSKERPGTYRELLGIEHFDKAIVVDQSPIGRTPRSNLCTYSGIFNSIRDLFSKLPAAKVRGYDAGRFSFNVKGGRCEKCQGDGLIEIEMHFLPPVYVTCEACAGKRYNRETLEITYKGLNIADILALTVDEAAVFFRAVPSILDVCQTFSEVGLGYLGLGQPATTISGGEAQRVKLATELSRKSTGRTLYLMDEPTTGLHFHDVAKLLEVLFRLRDAGNTLVVIEHNLDVIKSADWVVDMGPDAGDEGGRVVVEGPPEVVAACESSRTGAYLKRMFEEATHNDPNRVRVERG